MRYRDLKLVERRRSEKGSPRIKATPGDQNYPSAVQDKRESAVRELQKYVNGYQGIELKDLYVTYTSVNKIGINPRSGYNTPIGVYSYPMYYLLQKISAAGTATAADYMGNQPNIWVFTPTASDRGLRIYDYDQTQFYNDIGVLKNYLLKNGWDETEFNDVLNHALRTVRVTTNGGASQHAVNLWWVCSNMANGNVKIKKNEKIRDVFKVGDWVTSPDLPSYNIFGYKIVKIDLPNATVKSYGVSDNSQKEKISLFKLTKTSPPPGAPAFFDIGDTVKVISSGKIGRVKFYNIKLTDGMSYPTDEVILGMVDGNDQIEVHPVSNITKTDAEPHDFKIGDDVKFKSGILDKSDIMIIGFASPNVAELSTTAGKFIGKVDVMDLMHDVGDLPDVTLPPVEPSKFPAPTSKQPVPNLPATASAQTTSEPFQIDNKAFTDLVKKGKSTGSITYAELNKILPADKVSAEQIEDALDFLLELSIDVIEESVIDLFKNMLIEEKKNATDPASAESVEWNRLFRVLGYQYVLDNGSGTIHPSEKTQAVFFSANYLKPIERIKNTDADAYEKNPFTDPKYTKTGLYDPVAVEKYIKNNYDQPLYIDNLPYGITIKSEKLQIKLLLYDADKWLKHIKDVSPHAIKVATDILFSNIQQFIDDTTGAKIQDAQLLISRIRPLLNDESETKLKKIIKNNAELAWSYVKTISRAPFPEAEPAFLTDPRIPIHYMEFLRRPWPEAEPMFSKTADHAYEYATLSNTRFEAGEPAIMKDPYLASRYAVGILKRRWPEAESTMKENIWAWEEYLRAFPAWGKIEDLKPGELFEKSDPNGTRLVSVTKAYVSSWGDNQVDGYNYADRRIESLSTASIQKIEANRFGFAVGQAVTAFGKPHILIGWEDDSGEYKVIPGTLEEILKIPEIYASLPNVFPKKLPSQYIAESIGLDKLKDENPNIFTKPETFKLYDHVIVVDQQSSYHNEVGVVNFVGGYTVNVKFSKDKSYIESFKPSELDYYLGK